MPFVITYCADARGSSLRVYVGRLAHTLPSSHFSPYISPRVVVRVVGPDRAPLPSPFRSARISMSSFIFSADGLNGSNVLFIFLRAHCPSISISTRKLLELNELL